MFAFAGPFDTTPGLQRQGQRRVSGMHRCAFLGRTLALVDLDETARTRP
ncbi:MAG: hypothetical protein R3F61_24020 [Myxococcota bacterium]